MLLALEIVGILSMLTFLFIGIWSFIIFNKIYGQLKYRNYLIEKVSYNLYLNNKCNNINAEDIESHISESKNDIDDSDNDTLKDDAINAYDFGALSPEKKES
jgi:hypothetical protein